MLVTLYHGTSHFAFAQKRNAKGETILWLTGERTLAESYARSTGRHTNSAPMLAQFSVQDLTQSKLQIKLWDSLNEIVSITGNVDDIKSLAKIIKLS